MSTTRLESFYEKALYLYPAEFRFQYASAMRQSLHDALSDAEPPQRNFTFLLLRDLTTSLLKEHFSMLRETFLRPALIFNAIVLAGIATVLALAIYVIPQQVLRQGANDPQIEMAENLAQSLKAGTPIEFALPTDAPNGPPNKSFFLITTDAKGKVLTSDVKGLSQVPPMPPPPPPPNGAPQNIEIRVKKSGDLAPSGGQQKQVRTMIVQTDEKTNPKAKITGDHDAHGKTQLNVETEVVEGPDDKLPLTAGSTTTTTIIPDDSIDMAHSLSPFLIAYDAQGKPVASQGKLNGKIPAPPKGVFENVRAKGEERISWEPQPGVRFAAVVLHVPAANNVKEGFVLAGRSLREVEIREKQLGDLAFLNWLVMMGLILVGTLAFGWFTRPRVTAATAA